MRKPMFIDSYLGNEVSTGDGWAIAKPYHGYGIVTRLYHAWLVFRAKATAVQFWEDAK